MLLGAAPPASAQEAQAERQPGFMVMQWQVCQDVAEINRISDVTGPILEALQDEGMISAWYDIRHGWGDEWNVGFVTVAASHRAWLDYWDEFVRRAREADPNLFSAFGAACTLHKDNFYSVRDSRDGGS